MSHLWNSKDYFVLFPFHKATWYKNHKPLHASNRINTNFDMNGIASLKIEDSMPHDSGIYEVIVENDAGTDKSSCNVNVNPASGIDKAPILESNQAKPYEMPKQKPVNSVPLQPPRVVIPLINTKLNEGGSVQLACKITGIPAPKVSTTKAKENKSDSLMELTPLKDTKKVLRKEPA
jgi:hypothetical protein